MRSLPPALWTGLPPLSPMGRKEPPSFAKRSSASSSEGKRPRQRQFRRRDARLCGVMRARGRRHCSDLAHMLPQVGRQAKAAWVLPLSQSTAATEPARQVISSPIRGNKSSAISGRARRALRSIRWVGWSPLPGHAGHHLCPTPRPPVSLRGSSASRSLSAANIAS